MSAVAKQTEVKERPIIFSGAMVKAILEGRKTQTRRVVKPQPDSDITMAHEDGAGNWIFWTGALRPDMAAFTKEAYPNGGGFVCPYGRVGDRLWVRETWQPYRAHSAERDAVISASLARFERGEVEDVVAEVQSWPFPPNGERRVLYAADFGEWAYDVDSDLKPWKSPLFLPRNLSRITLEITNVRVERVQEISEVDAIAEGLLSQKGDGGGAGPGFKWKGTGYHGAGFSKDGARTFHFPNGDGRCACNVGDDTPAQCAYREAWDSINAKRGFSWELNPWVWVITFKKL